MKSGNGISPPNGSADEPGAKRLGSIGGLVRLAKLLGQFSKSVPTSFNYSLSSLLL